MTSSSQASPAGGETATSEEIADAALPRVFLTGQIELLEAAAGGAEATSILEGLIELVEAVIDDVTASVLRYQPDASALAVAAAPRLPSDLRENLDGRHVGAEAGPLGRACWTNEAAVAEDIETDPHWADASVIARSYGLRSCWAVPIPSDGDQPHGLLVVYSSAPGAPSDDQGRLLREAARVARVVFARDYTQVETADREVAARRILAKCPIGIYRTSPDGELLYANPALVDLLGADAFEELTPSNVHDWFTTQSARSDFEAAIDAEDTVQQREARLSRLDGGPIDIIERAWTVRDEDGSLRYYEGTIQDITERKEAQRALRTSEKKLRIILNNAQPIIFMLDAEGTFVVSEGADLEHLDLQPGEAVGESVFDVYKNYPHLLDQIQLALNGESVIFASRVAGRDFETWCTPFYDDQGDLQGCIGMSTDVTPRREAETQLRETEHFYEQLLDRHPIEVAVFDKQARYEYANAQAIDDAELRDWVIGRTNEELFRERDLDSSAGQRRDQVIRQVAETGEAARLEETIEAPEGPRHYLRMHVPMTNLEGDVTHVAVSGLDVTERVRHRKELQNATAGETGGSQDGAMLENMSRAVRTPLTTITGFAEVLKTEGVEIDVHECADLILESSRRLMDTVDTVLQLSKLNDDDRSLKREPVNVGDVADAVVTEQAGRTAAEDLDVRLDGPAQDVVAYLDPEGVRQILTHLVRNSVNFTPPDGNVVVGIERKDKLARIEVRDTGIGIRDSFQTEMFEPFTHESADVGPEYEGSGLGLTLVKELVEQHDGSLEVDSEQGEGTTMRVYLPLYRE